MRMANQRERARRAERDARRTVEEFMQVASHELRAPLAAAKMTVQLAERELGRLELPISAQDGGGVEGTRALLAGVSASLERQEWLVGELLDVARIQSGALALVSETLDLIELACEVVREQRLVAPARTVAVRSPEEPVGLVAGDARRLRQVLTNFLTNAVKYSPPATPITVRVRPEGPAVRVAVQDREPGLSPHQQVHVWERYHRVRGVEVLDGTGTASGSACTSAGRSSSGTAARSAWRAGRGRVPRSGSPCPSAMAARPPGERGCEFAPSSACELPTSHPFDRPGSA
jgi:signal transduction histidine kinase